MGQAPGADQPLYLRTPQQVSGLPWVGGDQGAAVWCQTAEEQGQVGGGRTEFAVVREEFRRDGEPVQWETAAQFRRIPGSLLGRKAVPALRGRVQRMAGEQPLV